MLMETYHLGFDQIAALTDRQIFEVCFHPRDEHGSIKVPDESEGGGIDNTLEAHLAALDNWARMFRSDPAKIAEARQKLKEKFGAKDA